MLSQSQLEQIKVAIEDKGYATNCSPHNLKFFSHQNAREVVDMLNNQAKTENCDEGYFDSYELNEPWGNCVAIYISSLNNEREALRALNNYADLYVKYNPETSREW